MNEQVNEMTNEVIDVVEADAVDVASGLGWKLGGAAIGVAGLIYAGYKLKKKFKSKKNDAVVKTVDSDCDGSCDSEEIFEEE